MRIAAQILVFGCDLTLLQMLRNIGPHVERIYIAYSELPWTYNKQARELHRNPTPLSIFDRSEYRDKIEIIQGTWETEEAQRNACVSQAKAAGFDLMICADADEFFLDEDYPRILEDIRNHPEADVYIAPFITFWKSLDTVILGKNGIHDTGMAIFALWCGRGVRHHNKRSVHATAVVRTLSWPCYHLGYLMSDEVMLRKLQTWGHASDFDRDWWYRIKWLGWTSRTRNMHPLYPHLWPRTIAYKGRLPDALLDFPVPTNEYHKISFIAACGEMLHSMRAYLRHSARELRRTIRLYFK